MADESVDALFMTQPDPARSHTPIFGHRDREDSHPFSPSDIDFPPLPSAGSSALHPQGPSPHIPVSGDGDGGNSLSFHSTGTEFPQLSSTVGYRRDRRSASYHKVPSEGFQDLLTQVMSGARTPQATHQKTTNGLIRTEYSGGLLVKIGMPGLCKEDVKVTVENNFLVVKGEAANAAVLNQATENPFASREETKYDERIHIVPDLYKLNQIKAEMKYGVLKVFFPKVRVEGTDVIVVDVE